MAEYRLHCFAQSGNAYKVALMLELTGADWEAAYVDFFAGEMRTAEFRALNPMGEVPVLEHESRVLTQSGAILHYLAERTGRFAPAEADRLEALRWILWDNHKLTSYMGTWRFMINFQAEEKRNADVIGFLEGRARTALGVLETHLSDRDWVVGEGPTIADLSLCGYMYYADEYPIAWEHDLPAIMAWLDRIAALPGWNHPYELMPGHRLEGA